MKKYKKVHIGYFSKGVDGSYCFHEGASRDSKYIAETLSQNITGGPYKVFKAYVKVPNGSNN